MLSECLIGGKAASVIDLNTFIVIPLRPFPNMTAPMYLKGNMPANPNTLPYTIPPIAPKIIRMEMHEANPASGFRKLATKGSAIIRQAITAKPPAILGTYPYLWPWIKMKI